MEITRISPQQDGLYAHYDGGYVFIGNNGEWEWDDKVRYEYLTGGYNDNDEIWVNTNDPDVYIPYFVEQFIKQALAVKHEHDNQ